jgi:hypothetical protein
MRKDPMLIIRNLKRTQIFRHRALIAFQLRAAGLTHGDIAAVLQLRSKEHSRSCVAKGRKLLTEIVIATVLP